MKFINIAAAVVILYAAGAYAAEVQEPVYADPEYAPPPPPKWTSPTKSHFQKYMTTYLAGGAIFVIVVACGLYYVKKIREDEDESVELDW